MSIRILNMPCRKVFSRQTTLGLGKDPMNPAMPNCVLCSVSTRKLRLGTRLYSVLLQCPVISIRAGSFPFACDLLDSGWYKSNRTGILAKL